MIPDIGLWNTIKGGIDLFDPAVRELVRKSGVVDRMDIQALQAVAGHIPGGFFGKFAQKATKWGGFTGINRMLQYLAASSARRGIEHWYELAQGSGRRAEWAQKRLADFGLKHNGPIPEGDIFKAMYRFAMDSQLQRNVLNDPLMFNDPKFRPFFLFKRFGYRQAAMIKDMMMREVVDRKNPMPLIRLAIGGWLGGTASVWAINQVKSALGGQPVLRKDDDMLQQITHDIGAIGAFGWVSDIMRVEKLSQYPDAIKFTLAPVFAADIETVVESWKKFAQDWERYGDGWLATRRNVGQIFAPLGTYPRMLAKRLYSQEQETYHLKQEKSREQTAIFELMLNGNATGASHRIEQWNRAYPDQPISISDVGPAALYDYIERQAKNYANAQSEKKTVEWTRIKLKRRAELMEKLSNRAIPSTWKGTSSEWKEYQQMRQIGQ
jgi:hypothetical protein